MVDTNESSSLNNKRINPLAAGVAGAVIGTGIGVAATKVLSDKKTRDMIMHTISSTGEKVAEYIKTATIEAKKRKH